MDRPHITKRSPISLDFLQAISVDPKRLAKYDQVRLTPSADARSAGRRVARIVIDLLDQRPICRGHCVLSGSLERGVRLKKPTWADLDVVCFLHEDLNGRPIESFEQFEKTRYGASKKIKEWLEKKLVATSYFDEEAVVDYFPGKGLRWWEGQWKEAWQFCMVHTVFKS